MTASYLYCIVKAPRRPATAEAPPGLPAASVPEAVKVTPALWLIAADVPIAEYSGAALERSLADLQWVSEVALAHQAVVEHFARTRGVTVIPMKLFTLFSSRDRAVADVAARRASLERTVARIAGAEEWGVRILRRAAEASGGASSPVPPTSGAAFLAAKKEARDQVRSAREMAASAAMTAFEDLAGFARESHRREDLPAAGAAPPLLDAAFLVPFRRRAAFARRVERQVALCALAGAELTLSGPWPAYNFVTPEPAR